MFEAATQLAAILTDQPQSVVTAMQEYGKYIGTAFQLVDDILDYQADPNETGKNVGDDLAEGKPTLPLLYAMWHGSESEAQLIEQAIKDANGLQHLQTIQQTMARTGAIEYTMQKAIEASEQAVTAISEIPDSQYKDALISFVTLCRTSGVV